MRLAITIIALSACAYASDWQTGKVEVHPTIVKDMFADYPGHLYRESQAGYTCMDGDADNAPVCISDEHSTLVVKPGYATVTLADGLQFEVPDYTQAGLVYDPHFIIQDDMYCMDNAYRPKGVGFITSGYQCTIFKRLVLKLIFPGGLGFAFQGKPTEQKTFMFQYRLGKSRKRGGQEIDIKGVGKGVFIVQTPSASAPSASAPGAPVTTDAATRKRFAQSVFDYAKEHGQRGPGFNITTEGPDATIYVLHFSGMNYAQCQGVFTTEAASELQQAGFTRYVCTDDGNTKFAFDLFSRSQPGDRPDIQGAAARKQLVETVREQVISKMGKGLPPRFNITADGPDATIYVWHEADVTYALCNGNYADKDYIARLSNFGFTQYTCTDDGSTKFTFDITREQPAPTPKQSQAVANSESAKPRDAVPVAPSNGTGALGAAVKPAPIHAGTIAKQQSQPSRSASGALIVKPEQSRPQPFGFHARMSQQEAIAAVGPSAVKAGYPKPMPYGSVLWLTTAPKPNGSFEDYALKFSTEGLFEVWTHTPGIHSADNGTQVRDEFNDLRKLIAGKYGEPKCFDFRDAGTSDRPDFFMLYLKDKEQHLSCTWNVGTRSAAILLEAESLDIDTAIVGVKYQFYPEFEKAQVGADDKKADSF